MEGEDKQESSDGKERAREERLEEMEKAQPSPEQLLKGVGFHPDGVSGLSLPGWVGDHALLCPSAVGPRMRREPEAQLSELSSLHVGFSYCTRWRLLGYILLVTKKKKTLFIWLHQVLVAACGIFS